MFQCDSEGDEGDDDKVSEKICKTDKNKSSFPSFKINSSFYDFYFSLKSFARCFENIVEKKLWNEKRKMSYQI